GGSTTSTTRAARDRVDAIVAPYSAAGARGNRARLVRSAVLYGALVALGVLFVVPLLWMLRTSLLPPELIAVEPPVWVSVPPRFQNYALMWRAGLFPAWGRDSVVVSAVGGAGGRPRSRWVACGFARA